MLTRLLIPALLVSCITPAAALVGGAQPVAGPHAAVMIVGSRGNSCTGIAIARDLVLTAAHCVPPGADYKLVAFDAQRQPRLRDTQSIARHPQFSQKTFDNHRATADVALIKFASPVVSGMPATLHGERLSFTPNDRFTVLGYGLTQIGNGKSGGTLRNAQLLVTGQPGTLQIRLMDPATRNERAGLGACTGDSGGPVLRDINGQQKVIGVVSWSTAAGNQAGCGGLTGVTPLSLYYPWIAETARKLGSPLN
ncbi:S1 family peptidase [Pseudorhodoplanes sinuspersici]|uniref:Peptidase S1 n=1 Tax=Pseudorhodoplanes sinuspersici TaxID=1235591 RepID=A0A1W6ZW06_9HYPH|nr:trypsin-like serine protease [Pseudorhodoplanes sinuspersici]ARQ00945.1 peptidase S1 [Pseudorhodoplanes sinuspersici]RKE72579.1 trypsin [Pseudorhodoplanes sinuspersici]